MLIELEDDDDGTEYAFLLFVYFRSSPCGVFSDDCIKTLIDKAEKLALVLDVSGFDIYRTDDETLVVSATFHPGGDRIC